MREYKIPRLSAIVGFVGSLSFCVIHFFYVAIKEWGGAGAELVFSWYFLIAGLITIAIAFAIISVLAFSLLMVIIPLKEKMSLSLHFLLPCGLVVGAAVGFGVYEALWYEHALIVFILVGGLVGSFSAFLVGKQAWKLLT